MARLLEVEDVVAALKASGILLVQDKQLPNVVTLLTGQRLATSWWSHTQGQFIFQVLTQLAEHPDVLLCKLLRGKVTLVHRRLWPALLRIVSRPEPWQVAGLSAAGHELLTSVAKADKPVIGSGEGFLELEKRLLVHALAIHTESGRHALSVQSWSTWSRHAQVKSQRSLSTAKQTIENAVERYGGDISTLPWRGKSRAAT